MLRLFRLVNECEGSRQERSSFQHNVITDTARKGVEQQVLGGVAPGEEGNSPARGGRVGLYRHEWRKH
jgi:hypothetical protein